MHIAWGFRPCFSQFRKLSLSPLFPCFPLKKQSFMDTLPLIFCRDPFKNHARPFVLLMFFPIYGHCSQRTNLTSPFPPFISRPIVARRQFLPGKGWKQKQRIEQPLIDFRQRWGSSGAVRRCPQSSGTAPLKGTAQRGSPALQHGAQSGALGNNSEIMGPAAL